jgi:K+-sensing histidine kinase KdpD
MNNLSESLRRTPPGPPSPGGLVEKAVMKTKIDVNQTPDEALAAQMRGDLLTIASRISHDLRTPLSGIVSTAEVLKEILEESDPSSAGLADSLLNSAEQIMQLLRQVSFMVKASANPPPLTNVSMGEAVWSALQRVESKMLKRKITVLQPERWPEVQGVVEWLEMIWWDLLVYALRPNAGDFKLELGWQAENDRYRFWIRDSRPCVAVEKCEKLFQSFESLHEAGRGAVLELSIVRRLVELLLGTCGCEENQQEAGMLLYFDLPSFGKTV